MQQKWESHCEGFFDWFGGNRKQKIINSGICSACDGSNVDGLFYQNDIVSTCRWKGAPNFEKKSPQAALRNFETLIQRKENEEIRAIYGAGSNSYLWFYVIVFFYYLKRRKIRLAYTYATSLFWVSEVSSKTRFLIKNFQTHLKSDFWALCWIENLILFHLVM